MKNLIFLCLSAIIPIVVAPGCKDDGVSPGGRPVGLYAMVVGPNGSALPDVNVHYIFYTPTNPVVQNVWLEYRLPTPQIVTLKVFSPFGREVETLVNEQQQQAGNYTISFDSSVTNGVYTYRVQRGDSVTGSSFYIRNDDVAQLVLRPPLLQSDASGKFFLSPSTLGVGRRFSPQEMILDSISIVLTHAGYQTFVQTFLMDTTVAVDRTFTMDAQ